MEYKRDWFGTAEKRCYFEKANKIRLIIKAKDYAKNNESDMGLIDVLDRAYLSVRYDNNYHIADRDLDCLLDKSLDLVELMTVICENILGEYGR